MSIQESDPALMFPDEVEADREVARKVHERASQQLARDYGNAFASAFGQRVLDDLIARFAGQTYSRGDHIHTAFREGQRSVIEHIARSVARAEPAQEKEQDYDHGQ